MASNRSAPFRLPQHVRPTHYALHVALDPERSKRYRGEVAIEIELSGACDYIELHSVDLKIASARVESGEVSARASVEARPKQEAIRLTFGKRLARGKARLQLTFSGKLRDDLRGLYYAESQGHRYGFTQLEATDARRFFPCFDEPAFKARFALEVTTRAEYAVIANAPVASTKKLADGDKRVRFEDTPLLSTYLVALAVGHLNASRTTYAGATPIRIWHVPGHEKLARYAREEAALCLTQLERYFGVPYPYGKLDLVAVPDFEFGAMENAGAVFFRETLLLVDPKRATVGEKRRVVEVMCHELAHMWYGNLVTMTWWDDLWLNEAFATWMAFEIVAKLHPELSMWTDFGHYRDSALGADALAHTHAVYTPVASAEEATENFDLITYEKGASVIRMLERYLTPSVFRRGVREYIKRHREGNAVAADLWAALERHAGEDVATVVRPWIEREGFPLVRLRAAGDNARAGKGSKKHGAGQLDSLVVRQERFRAQGPDGTPKGSDKPWPVPLVLRRGKGSSRHLITTARERITVGGRGAYLYANADEGGFFRPLHEGGAFQALLSNVSKLNAAERLGLVSHQWALAQAGYADLADFLELVTALRDEQDPDVLATVVGPLDVVLDQLAGGDETLADALRAHIAAVFRPAWEQVGMRTARADGEPLRLRRGVLLSLMGLLAEDVDVATQAVWLARLYLDDPATLDSNLAASVLTLAARHDASLLSPLRHASQHGATPQEQRRARLALCDFRDARAIDRTLKLTTTATIPAQDRVAVLARLLWNRAARERTWHFLKDNWHKLDKRMPTLAVSHLIDATPALQTAAYRREVQGFFRTHPVPTARRALRQADERFRLDAAFRKRATPQLRAWLARQAP